jgi:hypothetical protein
MRRLQTGFAPIVLGPGFQTFASIFIPANAWADLHEVWVRTFLTVDDMFMPLPPLTNIDEQITSNPAMTPITLPEGMIPAQPGFFDMVITRRFLRHGNEVTYYDDDDTSGLIGVSPKLAGISGQPCVSAFPVWAFDKQISFDFSIRNTGTPYPIQIHARQVIALVQAPLNLRTI